MTLTDRILAAALVLLLLAVTGCLLAISGTVGDPIPLPSPAPRPGPVVPAQGETAAEPVHTTTR